MTLRINKISFFVTPIFISLIIVTLSLFSREGYNFYVLTIIIFLINIVFISKYLTNYLSEIIIDEELNTCHFKFIVDFTQQEDKYFLLDELNGVYEKITKARGVQSEVFRVYKGDLVIVTITPNADGWSKGDCDKLATVLGSKNN